MSEKSYNIKWDECNGNHDNSNDVSADFLLRDLPISGFGWVRSALERLPVGGTIHYRDKTFTFTVACISEKITLADVGEG